jgi:hypothetical protein
VQQRPLPLTELAALGRHREVTVATVRKWKVVVRDAAGRIHSAASAPGHFLALIRNRPAGTRPAPPVLRNGLGVSCAWPDIIGAGAVFARELLPLTGAKLTFECADAPATSAGVMFARAQAPQYCANQADHYARTSGI